jgi:branched-chain amino acid transport system substrate-binding protein
MKTKITLSLAVVAAIIVAFVLFNRPSAPPTTPPVKVGANFAMTGTMPYWSTQIEKGLRVALAEANNMPSRPRVDLVVEDNQGEPKNAIAAFQKLATIDKVSCIVTTHTFIAKPQQPLALKYQIPLLGTVVSAVGFGDENIWSFLDWPSQQDLTPPVAAYCWKRLGAKVAVTLVVNDDYGLDGAKVFIKDFVALGGTVKGQETFGNADKDVRPQLAKLLAQHPDVIYTVGREGSLVSVVKQGREAGFHGTFVGVNAFDSPVVWDGLGAEAEGIVYGGIGVRPESKEAADRFQKEFIATFKTEPDWVALYGYSIGQYLFDIAASTSGDSAKIREALSHLDVNTARGLLHMTDHRSISTQAVVFVRRSGKNAVEIP